MKSIQRAQRCSARNLAGHLANFSREFPKFTSCPQRVELALGVSELALGGLASQTKTMKSA